MKPPKECPAAPILNGRIFEEEGVARREAALQHRVDHSGRVLGPVAGDHVEGIARPVHDRRSWVLPMWFGAATKKPWLASVSTRTIDWMAKPPDPWEKMIRAGTSPRWDRMSSTATAEVMPMGPSSG